MGRYAVHRTDTNAVEIYKAARKIGFSVVTIHRPIDSLWGIYDQSVAVEVKTTAGKLEPGQVKFFETFKGMKREIRSVGDVIALYAEMRARHDVLFGVKG